MKVFYAIIRLDPAFDALLPKDANIEKVATGVIFTEGPVWRPKVSSGSAMCRATCFAPSPLPAR